jgi:radical SAM protein with 4Fe4S-binding SPASM domain
MEIRAICAPQFYRIKEEFLRKKSEKHFPPADQKRMGCLAGINICFVSHLGDIFPCGYLPVSAGNVKSKPLSEIWRESVLLEGLRNEELLTGKCGLCEYRHVCGGCRARAFYKYGSELAEEPYCLYEPHGTGAGQ